MLELLTVFAAVFLAELGDKTQVATVLIAGKGDHHPLSVVAAAGGALLLSTVIAVALGHYAGRWLDGVPLKLVAGLAFIGLGLWSVAEHFRT